MEELKKIDEFTYEMLGRLLFSMIPEYKINFNFSEDDMQIGNYLFMNEFATALGHEIKKDPTSNFVCNSFMFINKIADSYNLEVLNILKVGILEILYTIPDLERKQVYVLLNDKLQKYFQECSKLYY